MVRRRRRGSRSSTNPITAQFGFNHQFAEPVGGSGEYEYSVFENASGFSVSADGHRPVTSRASMCLVTDRRQSRDESDHRGLEHDLHGAGAVALFMPVGTFTKLELLVAAVIFKLRVAMMLCAMTRALVS